MSVRLDAPFIVSIHPILAEILVNNLLSNALRHNFNHGRIIISSENNEIRFPNTGNPTAVDPLKIFKRFVKRSTSIESNGLGLAIADEICWSHHLLLTYTYHNQLHCFTLSKEV